MPIDPEKPLLPLSQSRTEPRARGSAGFPRPPEPYAKAEQLQKLGPKFTRLERLLNRDGAGLELRADPSGVAPERILVLEVNGSLSAFLNAAQKVDGLDFIAEQELVDAEDEEEHTLYLFIPDEGALRQIVSLWKRWENGKPFQKGLTPWREVFDRLADVRPWGPKDRLEGSDAERLRAAIEGREPGTQVRLEIELAPFHTKDAAEQAEREVTDFVRGQGGRVVHQARISEIAYHGLLADVPVETVQSALEHTPDGLAGSAPILHIRPQSLANAVRSEDMADGKAVEEPQPKAPPIAALIDGVPVSEHSALEGRLSVDDVFGLEGVEPEHRSHGTAMASLITRGDLNENEPCLPRLLHVIPVLGEYEEFPQDRLIIDVIWQAVISMKEGSDAAAPDVLIVNLSLGNSNQPFQKIPSAWARLVDQLAYKYGILFIVSAGNVDDYITLPTIKNSAELEDADDLTVSKDTLRGVAARMANRRVFAPAETLNGLTVGAANSDSEPTVEFPPQREPYIGFQFSNPSSALGPGIGGATKPDLLMPGGREHLTYKGSGDSLIVGFSGPRRGAGLKVAAASRRGIADQLGFSGCTSGATALATRTCHRIHDALEEAYGENFTSRPTAERAALLKALIGHSAAWNQSSADLIREIVGPADSKYHTRQRDNIRRFLGLGWADSDIALSCVDDRATFWACGEVNTEEQAVFAVPIPACIDGQAVPHRVSATIAWFSPVHAGRQAYRGVRLEILKPEALGTLGVQNSKHQPDEKQSHRGTLVSRQWVGEKAPNLAGQDSFELRVQRKPDQGIQIDEPVPFGLAVSMEMAGAVQLYNQVRARIAPRVRIT